ncbi:uncharacterized protein G2W53_033227 [Senna tora]|uniref:Uncharacterized protein n=1 Tax=Senna tora TaxID=362788 RepID=A0A834T0P7_9FABA|nr:uncharacterized protein G2W53_033227 [Senna tora]
MEGDWGLGRGCERGLGRFWGGVVREGSILELRRGWDCERGKGLTVLVEEGEWGSRFEGRLWRRLGHG